MLAALPRSSEGRAACLPGLVAWIMVLGSLVEEFTLNEPDVMSGRSPHRASTSPCGSGRTASLPKSLWTI